MARAPIFSADSHTMEPADLWLERIDRVFRDRAPRVITNHAGRPGSFFVAEGLTPCIERHFADVSETVRRKITCENIHHLYAF